MNFLRCLNTKKILSQNHTTIGTVVKVQTCWWLKVNTKPIRNSALDGALFPHIIHFTYAVDNVAYKGSRYISWCIRCPQPQEWITVYYDMENPSRYAVRI
ncbi:MAG: sugar ABC transporter permease [Ruminococcaceae bacterium]|nr:sugar ABC transporter permease [Oscillospiraceae bacterium]